MQERVRTNTDGIGGGMGGRMGPRPVKRLGRKDSGIEVAGQLRMEVEADLSLRPSLTAKVYEGEVVDGEDSGLFGNSRAKKDGSFSIKVPASTETGILSLATDGFRFVENAKFSIEDGQVVFSSDLTIERGPLINLEIQDADGPLEGIVRGELLRSRARPNLNPNKDFSSYSFGKASTSRSLLKFDPLHPQENVWAVIRCKGYATVRIPISQDDLQWGGIYQTEVVMERETEVSVRVLDTNGNSVEGANLRFNHTPVIESQFYWNKEMDSNPAVLTGLGSGTLYTSVSGPGFLNVQSVVEVPASAQGPLELDLVAITGFGVRGQLLWGDGTPASGAKIWMRPVVDGKVVHEVDETTYWSSFLSESGAQWSGEADEQGHFTLSGFQAAETFELSIQCAPPESSIPEGLSKLKRRRYLRKNSIWCSVSGVPANFEKTEFVLEADSGGVHGRVLNDLGKELLDYTIRAFADCDGPTLEANAHLPNLEGDRPWARSFAVV